MKRLGYIVGHQATAELLLEDWAERDFRRIISYCRTAEAFQDVPFSLPDTFVALDAAFPESRFVLTLRSSADEWFDSMVRFHSRVVGADGVPTEDDLARATYRYPGYLLRVMRLRFGDAPLYDRSAYIDMYNGHSLAVQTYFAKRSDSLLVLDVSDPDAFRRLCKFLGREEVPDPFPHLNAFES